MKKVIVLTLNTVLLLGVFAFETIHHYADILKELQMEPGETKDEIFNNFQDGVLNFPYSTVVTKFAIGKREAAVKELGDYIKGYTESAEFAAKYKQAREAARPQGVATQEEKIKAKIEQVKQDIQETESVLLRQTGDMKKLYEGQLKELKKQLKALSDPTNPEHAWYAEQVAGASEAEKNFANESLASWQENFPPTVKELVQKRLADFLDLTKDIDFNAKLVQSGSKVVFANPELEAKSWEWKRCFRCGRETITAARVYAQHWLASLN